VTEQKIQSEAYWQEFSVQDGDLEEIGVLFLETERPMLLSELAYALISSRCRREESALRRRLARGTLYRPNQSYAVGDTLVFAQLGFAVGTVTGVRDGNNPEYGEFKVIDVDLLSDGKTRFFAAELKAPHKLSLPDDGEQIKAFVPSPDEVYEQYGDLVAQRLQERLGASSNYESFRGVWLPTAMLADVHVGYVNIAEAALDVEGRPLEPKDLLTHLDLPQEIPEAIQAFSLNCALAHDARFDDVGDAEHVLWSLRVWEPEGVVVVPNLLRYRSMPYDRTSLDVTHLQIEREIDDELSGIVAAPAAERADAAILILSYPHWRSGTLPLTGRTRCFFPKGHPEQHSLFTWVDRTDQSEFPGWVVHDHSYVYGLVDWYRAKDVPVGAYLQLRHGDDPSRVTIELVQRRMQRDWVRTAVRQAEGEIAFQMQKRPIACEYDELFLVDELDPADIDQLRQELEQNITSFDELIQVVFVALAKLSPTGMVHAKTLYSAVNIVRRTPPGPLFAALFRLSQFVTTGDGYWMYQTSAGVR